MIIFDRQAGPLQNFNRSHVMVIGRSVSFSDPARPPGGGVGRPKHPKIPKKKKKMHAFQNPRNIFEKTNLVGKICFQLLESIHIVKNHLYVKYIHIMYLMASCLKTVLNE